MYTSHISQIHFHVKSPILLVLRFFLDLRDLNAYLNGTSQTRDLGPF
jgi:hypothetical protein